MVDLSSIKKAEKEIEVGKVNLANAVKTTFVVGTKVFMKGPRGEKETQVLGVEGEELMLETSKGSMKRHYSVVRPA